MKRLSKTSLSYYLSEYLADLGRAGVREFSRVDARTDESSEERSQVANRRPDAPNVVVERPNPTNVETVVRTQNNSVETRPIEPTFDPNLAVVNRPNPPASEDRASRLAALASEVAKCSLCPKLVANRTQTVFGSGNPHAELCFIGEGPGAEEDLQGLPFVGRSGQLLTDMIEKGMGLSRRSVYICNVVRCRPPQNRNPEKEEANACRKFLDATLDIVQPKYICCLGSIAATNLLKTEVPIGKLRGEVHEYRGAKVVCTYHPAYLLRNPSAKKLAWEDLQLLMREMGVQVKGR